MSAGPFSDAGPTAEGFAPPGSGVMPQGSGIGLPTNAAGAAVTGQEFGAEPPSEAPEVVVSEDDVAWIQAGGLQKALENDTVRQWVAQNPQVLEPYFAPHKTAIQQPLQRRIHELSQAQQQANTALEDARALHHAELSALIDGMYQLSERHGFEIDEDFKQVLIAKAHGKQAEYSRQRSDVDQQANMAALQARQAAEIKVREASTFNGQTYVRQDDPQVQQYVANIAATAAALQRSANPQQRAQLQAALSYQDTQLTKYVASRVVQAQTAAPVAPSPQPVPTPTTPNRGPQRMAGRGGGQAPLTFDQLYTQYMTQAAAQYGGDTSRLTEDEQTRVYLAATVGAAKSR